MTREEVADYLRVTVKQVQDWTTREILPCHRIGKHFIRYNRAEVRRMFSHAEAEDPVIKWLEQQITLRRQKLGRR